MANGTKVAKVEPHTGERTCHYCKEYYSKTTPATDAITLRVPNPDDHSKHLLVLIYTCTPCKLKTIESFGLLEEGKG